MSDSPLPDEKLTSEDYPQLFRFYFSRISYQMNNIHGRLLALENQSKQWQQTADLFKQKWEDLSIGLDEKTNDLKRMYSDIDERTNELTTALEPTKEEIEQLRRSTEELKIHLDQMEGNTDSRFKSLEGQKVDRNEFEAFRTQADKFMKELASALEEQSIVSMESQESPEETTSKPSVDAKPEQQPLEIAERSPEETG